MKGRVRGNKSQKKIEVRGEERTGGSVEGCLWRWGQCPKIAENRSTERMACTSVSSTDLSPVRSRTDGRGVWWEGSRALWARAGA